MISERLMNGLQACGNWAKVNDIGASCTEVQNTLNDTTLSPIQKTAKCTAETVFMVCRTGEITQKATDFRVKATLNGLATVADAGRKIVDLCLGKQPRDATIQKIAVSVLTGSLEAATNLAFATGNYTLGYFGTFASTTIGIWRLCNRPTNPPAIANV